MNCRLLNAYADYAFAAILLHRVNAPCVVFDELRVAIKSVGAHGRRRELIKDTGGALGEDNHLLLVVKLALLGLLDLDVNTRVLKVGQCLLRVLNSLVSCLNFCDTRRCIFLS